MRRLAVVLLFPLLLSGCTTMMTESQRDESYAKSLADIKVSWSKAERLVTGGNAHYGTAVAGSYIPAGLPTHQREEIIRESFQIQELLSATTDKYLEPLLRASGATGGFIADGTRAAGELKFQSLGGTGNCSLIGCETSLWVRVDAYDREQSKVVWTGTYKVGAPGTISRQTERVAESFYVALVQELRSQRLIGVRRATENQPAN